MKNIFNKLKFNKSKDGNKEKMGFIKNRKSLRVKLTFTLTILIILTIFFVWLLNKTFLGDYYLNSKINTLGNTFTEVEKIYSNKSQQDTLTSDEILNIERLCKNRNVNIYIIDNQQFDYPDVPDDGSESKRIRSSLQDYIFKRSISDHIICETKEFTIFKLYDERMKSNYIDLIGILDNGYIVYMRTNFESIQESAAIANKFLAYVGILSVFIGTLIMFYISKRFTKPVLELAGIAKKMSDLDFNVKYKVSTQDEIGELGYSINSLSEKLENTISELKTANNELLSDIQNKIQIDEMRKEFLSNVSHELKTPIALIQGYSEGLKDNINDDEESREFYCDVIIDEAKKMNEMVKKIISLNQIESGNNQASFERFDIISLIKSVLNSTEILFQQKNVTLHFEEYEPIYVWADEYMVEEVVTNYISNALNHVDGANIIEIKLIKNNGLVRVAVFNTGANIPEDELDKIWIKFYKVDKARTREYGGSGIGLSIVKAIMASLNQNFGVVNHQNGVEFWFELDMKNE